MAPYVVLARKWRPREFATLVGQGHVARALGNALASGRIPHAFLFTGIRGVGKTTTARLLARCLNCDGGISPQPCGECPSCLGVMGGNHPDVLEIDAASHTGVDKIRDLLETVRYAPVMGRTKVYILDEVHMLSTSAFNALLKTLEEPPPHVVFIFATTEARKIPPTILSRCQRYDLRRLTREELREHFGGILEKEGIPWDPEAVAAVARAADGSIRDGLSLLDQAIAHGEGAVRYDSVGRLLGLTDREAVVGVLERLLAGDAPGVLESAQAFHAAGVEPGSLVGDLLDALHQTARRKVVPTPPGGEPAESRLTDLAGRHAHEHLQMVYQVLLRGGQEVRLAEDPLQALEMLLLRVAFLRPVPDLEQLLQSLGRLPPGGRGEATGGGAPPPAGAEGGAGRNGRGPETTGASSASRATLLERIPGAASKAAPGGAVRRPPVGAGDGTTPPPGRGGASPPQPPAAVNPASPVAGGGGDLSSRENRESIPDPLPVETRPPLPAMPLSSWEGLVFCATRSAPALALKLEQQVVCLEVGGGESGEGNSRESLPLELHLRLVSEVFGPPAKLAEQVRRFLGELGHPDARVRVDPAMGGPRPETLGESRARAVQERLRRLESAALAHPVVARVMERFQARLVAVHPLTPLEGERGGGDEGEA